MELLLELKNSVVHYGGVKALDGASLAIDENEIVVLMGPNGAGKSTVLRAMFGLTPLTSGTVFYEGQKIQPNPLDQVARGIAFVPQGRRVFPHLTVEENLELGGYPIPSQNIIAERIHNLMELFPVLSHRRRTKAGTLSGGQQQMLAIARGLMTDPKILLLDEPTLGLAPKVVKEVFETIARINADRKTAIMVVEHNIKSVLAIAHRAYVLDKGHVVASNRAAVLATSDILEKVFLGKPLD